MSDIRKACRILESWIADLKRLLTSFRESEMMRFVRSLIRSIQDLITGIGYASQMFRKCSD